jgi:NTE family protein
MKFSDSVKRAFFIPFGSALAFTAFSLLLTLPSASLNAREQEGKRPKVGLALSGGGAKGIAHIGVLKVMEEAGLKPDLITGVSMGSIVGGFYAIGYSADSLEKIVRSIDWDLMLSDNIPENKVIFLEKSSFNNNILSLPVTRKKISLPSGLIRGQQIESTLSRYTWPAADIRDFSELPIPFMCVGTDITTCKNVEIKEGYLADAMRASMAVPTIFTPVRYDSILFIDGGLIRNFAVSEAIDMGADIVIGSYVGGKLSKEEELGSITGIMSQIAFYTGYYDSKEQAKLLDILIEPDLKNYSAASFNSADSIIASGYRAALPYKEYFKNLADSLNRIEPRKEVKNILGKKQYTFDRIWINGNTIHSDRQILGVLGIEPGDNVDNDLISERIELLYGKGWFEKVKYSIKPEGNSLDLIVDCYEKPNPIITGSIHYDNTLDIGIIAGFSGENLLTQRSKLNADAFIGKYYRLRLKYIQFIDRNQIYGISANIYADKNFLPTLFLFGNINECISHNSYYDLMLHTRAGLNQMISISAGIERLDLMPNRLINTNIKRLSSNFLTYSFDYSLNTIDTKHFPNKGDILTLTAGSSIPLAIYSKTGSVRTKYTRSEPGEYSFKRYISLHASIKHYSSIGKKLTIGLSADAMMITDTLSNQGNFYLLGGPQAEGSRSVAMTGYYTNEVASKKFAGAGVEVDFEILRKVHLNFTANSFVVQEVGSENNFDVFYGYGLGAGYMSLIGPVKAGITYGNNRHGTNNSMLKGYVSLGYNF